MNADNKGGEGAMIISGAIIPVGVKNKNGWGILDSEIQNVVATLKGKALTVCPRNGDAHGCDFDPKAEIGKMSNVWYDPFVKKIKAMAEITDSVAQRKISEGTWKPNWSVRLAAKENVDGWATGCEGKNVTVVPEGAWPDANFNVLASSEDGFETFLIANFSVSAPAPSEPSTQARTVLGTIEYVPTAKELNQVISGLASSPNSPEKNANVAGNSKGGKNMADTDKKETTLTMEQLQAALVERDAKIAALEKKALEQKPVEQEKVASKKTEEKVASEKKDDKTVSQEELIASKAKEIADQQIAAYKASLAHEAAVSEYVAAATKRGIKDINTKIFEGMTAEQITAFTASLNAIKTEEVEDDKTAGLKYPASTPEESGGLSVGIPSVDSDGKVTWVTKV